MAELLSLREALVLKGCARYTLMNAIRTQRIAAIQAENGRWWIDRTDLEGWALGGRRREDRVATRSPDTPIALVPFHTRTFGLLRMHKVKTMADLAQWSEADLRLVYSCGPALVEDAKARLAEFGLSFADYGGSRWQGRRPPHHWYDLTPAPPLLGWERPVWQGPPR
jgi:hypothetical protein